jgi:uroporphyrinogen decarboxylase
MSQRNRFLRACRGQDVDRTPIWLMRQAGRYLQEYRDVRQFHSFLEMCKRPELAVEVTLQPIQRFELDAAIIFSDILLPLECMGIGLEFTDGGGPLLRNPLRTEKDVERMGELDPEKDLGYTLKALEMARSQLNGTVPLIGFAGAPFTLASYAIEGGGSRNYIETKTMIYSEPASFHLLMEKLTNMVISYLNAQVRHGAQAVQVFDSWVGCLSATDYKTFVLPHMKRLFASLNPKAPRIHFALGASHMLKLVGSAGADVTSVDWRTPLDEAWKQVGTKKAIQGNLDPALLFGSKDHLVEAARDILKRAANRNGHIFNLGHGIYPGTPVDNVSLLIEVVHKGSRRK